MDTDVEAARVRDDAGGEHPTLFPMAEVLAVRPSPRSVCEALGLNWLAAQHLYQRKRLSFDPAAVASVTPAQEAELAFLGTLVTGGCDEGLLSKMLGGLRRPYAYRLDRLYYDWQKQCWQPLPRAEDYRERFEHWLDELVEHGEGARLESIGHSVRSAIRTLRSAMPW